jgi:hypothetical protein
MKTLLSNREPRPRRVAACRLSTVWSVIGHDSPCVEQGCKREVTVEVIGALLGPLAKAECIFREATCDRTYRHVTAYNYVNVLLDLLDEDLAVLVATIVQPLNFQV